MGAAVKRLIGKSCNTLRWEKSLYSFKASDPIFPETSAALIKTEKKPQSYVNYACMKVWEMWEVLKLWEKSLMFYFIFNFIDTPP